MSDDENKEGQVKFVDLKMWLNIGMFGLAICGAIGSYYKTTSEIREEIQTARQNFLETLTQNNEKMRAEMRDQYATKESSSFVNASLQEIKSDLKEIKGQLNTRR